MSITTYAELKTAVASWLNRNDLTSQIPDFIRLGEQRMYFGGADPLPSPPLRIPAMQTRETGTITSSAISFPTRFIEPIRLAATSNGQSWSLQYVSPEQFSDLSNSSAMPTVYTYLNNEIQTAGTGAASYVLDYYQSLALLSGDSDTNWILTNAPSCYLYAALLEAAPFLGDDSRVVGWQGALKASIQALNNATKRQGSGLAARVG